MSALDRTVIPETNKRPPCCQARKTVCIGQDRNPRNQQQNSPPSTTPPSVASTLVGVLLCVLRESQHEVAQCPPSSVPRCTRASSRLDQCRNQIPDASRPTHPCAQSKSASCNLHAGSMLLSVGSLFGSSVGLAVHRRRLHNEHRTDED